MRYPRPRKSSAVWSVIFVQLISESSGFSVWPEVTTESQKSRTEDEGSSTEEPDRIQGLFSENFKPSFTTNMYVSMFALAY